MTDPATRLDKDEARQGKTGVGVRYVLIGGLVLIIIAGIIMFIGVR